MADVKQRILFRGPDHVVLDALEEDLTGRASLVVSQRQLQFFAVPIHDQDERRTTQRRDALRAIEGRHGLRVHGHDPVPSLESSSGGW